ncbi:MAG TPA: glycosyltransferase [Thermodesulfobacteriota bacterium]|nr:glycosyltransferase [Thermodesulfobacteriota bacterium]
MVAAWMIEALKKDNSVSILTWKHPDFEEVNRFYGTSLNESELGVHSVNPALRSIIDLDPDPATIQRQSYLMRLSKKLNSKYDVVISAENEIDLGCRGIQYFHYPYLYGKIKPDIDLPRHRRFWETLKGSYRPWMLLSGFSYSRMVNNLTLVNSDWTGNKVREFYGISPITLYPPIPGTFPDIHWNNRENGFVCIGRFCPGKNFETIIKILTKVRARIPDIHLHVIGTPSPFAGENEYYSKLMRVVRENSPWVLLHENLSREKLINLISRHRYGIHANIEEHFGIAVGEMIKAGCIVFVHNSGGQVEIVGGDERLVYRTEGEAVEKIVRVMGNPDEQMSLIDYLNSRKEMFSTERFMRDIQEIVRQFQGDK